MSEIYTAEERAAGFAWANAKSKVAHDRNQLLLPESERTDYTVTATQFADACRDKVGENYYDQMLQERVTSPENVALAERIAATLNNPTVAQKLAELQEAVAAAETEA